VPRKTASTRGMLLTAQASGRQARGPCGPLRQDRRSEEGIRAPGSDPAGRTPCRGALEPKGIQLRLTVVGANRADAAARPPIASGVRKSFGPGRSTPGDGDGPRSAAFQRGAEIAEVLGRGADTEGHATSISCIM